jgi:hypothetical protein
MLLGNGPIGKFAITERAGANIKAAVFAAAGIGAATFVMNSNAASVLNSAGVGTATIVLHSFDGAVLNSAGTGGTSLVLHSFNGAVLSIAGGSTSDFPGSRIDNRVFTTGGAGGLQGISYAFFLDAEKYIPDQELRTYKVAVEYRIASAAFDPARHADVIVATVNPENRTAIVPFEDRVYQVGADPRRSDTPNRKRT